MQNEHNGNREHLNRWYFICLGIHLLCAHYFFGQIGDDAFIFFRYASNLANGYGLVWNPLETPVEGYSSPLWVLLLAMTTVFADVVSGAKVLGMVFMTLATWRVWQLSKVLQGHPVIATLGCCLSLGVHYWSSAGLETGLYALIFTSSMLAILHKSSMVWIALLGICRPEGIFLVPIAFVLCSYDTKRWKENAWVFLPMGVWLLFRAMYYGEILPNTYYAKVSTAFGGQLLAGFWYASWLIPSIVIGFFTDTTHRKIWILPLSLLLIIIGGGGDWMWHGRLLVPVYIVLWACGSSLVGWRKLLCCLPLCVFWIPLPALSKIVQGERMPERAYQEGSLVSTSQQVAEMISTKVDKGALIAVNHAGALPYFLEEYFFVDMTGLNDHYIARLEGGLHNKYDADYIVRRAPDLVVLNSFSNPATEGFIADYWEGETALYDSPQFKEQYVAIAQYWERLRTGGGKAYIVLFQRRRSEY